MPASPGRDESRLGILALGITIAATGGLAGIAVGMITGAGTAGEIGLAGLAAGMAGAGGATLDGSRAPTEIGRT